MQSQSTSPVMLINQTHTVISIDEEKTLGQIQHPFVTKTLNKVGVEGTFLNLQKSSCEKTHGQP